MKETEHLERLKLYNSMLPFGYKKVIAERLNCRPATVSDFFNGKRYNKQVEDAVLDVLAELQEERKTRLEKAGLL